MSYVTELAEKHPVRKTAAQKEAFRAWALAEGQALGYPARIEENGRMKHRNIIFGDPEQARIVLIAHYDTPAVMLLPNLLMPCNPVLFVLYQALVIGLMVLASGLVSGFAGLATGSATVARAVMLMVYFGLLLLMLLGPANKHNVNDNTSGVAAIFTLMRRLPAEKRHAVAFILFDNEEKGTLGSGAYAKEHLQQQFTRMVVNLDCVGVGEHVLVTAGKLARQRPEFAPLKRVLTETPGRTVVFSDKLLGSSDHKRFKCGVWVVSCRRAPVVGYYTPWCHTARDTACDEENIDFLAEAFDRLVGELG